MQGLDTTYQWVVLIIVAVTLTLLVLGRFGR